MKNILGCALVLLSAGWMRAQTPAATLPTADSGYFSNVSFGSSHDSSLGWSTESDYSVGYDVNRSFSIESGIPVYLLVTTQSTTKTGATDQTQTDALGDFFLRFSYAPKMRHLSYGTSLTGTAPTGNTSLGLSTGRAGVGWGNHVEKDAGWVTPFGDVSLSNSQWPDQHFQRSYTVLGASAAFRGGAHFDFGEHFSTEASLYDVAPFGTQKVYSRVVVHGASANPNNAHKGRPYASQAVTVGDSSIARDHGFGAGVSFDPTKRADLSVDYNHSVVQGLNSVCVTVSYRLGHLAGQKARMR